MLNCKSCGLTNRPYDTECSHCEQPLQDATAAAAKRKEWDALSPALRLEFERTFDRMREGTMDHIEWLRRHRLAHAFLGAMLVNLTMNGCTFFVAPWTIPVDLALGAGAGLALNRWHGGSWQGTGLFFGAGIVSFLIKLPFLGSGVWSGSGLVVSFAMFFLAIAGYLIGIHMEFGHSDRSVTR
jgi:hypothetical protein